MKRMLCAWMLAGLAGCSFGGKIFCRQEHADPSRAGFPEETSAHARPSDDGHYVGYRVGGGAVKHGDEPGPEEGTWGWDYEGHLFPSRIILGWWHGARCQGGGGAYRTDGPRPLQELKEKKQE